MFSELENALVGLVLRQRYFAEVLSRCRKIITKEVPTLGVSVTKTMNLYINPDFFKTLTPMQREEALIHECLHLLRNHCTSRAPKQPQIWNIASDCAINQSLPELSKFEGCVTLESFRKLVKKDSIEAMRESEYYYRELMEAIDDGRTESQKVPQSFDDHGKWGEKGEGEGEGQEISDEERDAVVKKNLIDAEKSTKRSGGNIPHEIEKYLNRLKKGKVNWKQQLKEFFNSVTHADKRKTRSKRNRRYGLLYAGKKKDYKYNIVVAVDESGSVYDKLLQTFFTEIDKLSTECANLYVMHCDTQVNNFYKYEKGMEIKRTGCGGTMYNPVFDYVKDNNIQVDGMVFFGDGDCFENDIRQPKFKVLWALPDHGHNPTNFGKVVRVVEDE